VPGRWRCGDMVDSCAGCNLWPVLVCALDGRCASDPPAWLAPTGAVSLVDSLLAGSEPAAMRARDYMAEGSRLARPSSRCVPMIDLFDQAQYIRLLFRTRRPGISPLALCLCGLCQLSLSRERRRLIILCVTKRAGGCG